MGVRVPLLALAERRRVPGGPLVSDPTAERRTIATLHQPQELVSRLGIVAKTTAQRARDRCRILLLHTAHHHAKVGGLDYHTNSSWLQYVADGFGNLLREPLLNL